MSSQQHNYHVRPNTDLGPRLQKRNSLLEYKTYDGKGPDNWASTRNKVKGPITGRAQEIR